MSRAVPSRPNLQPVRRAYVVTTTSRVPGRANGDPEPGASTPARGDGGDGPPLPADGAAQ